ncbi:hypothetical protein ECANGB1_62 [Enterospora canceri]|uniref:Uncharacterized protein n=1 Tax=Enterospora canceri TaxID=1081671 RepID=A0A1Y1S8F6_9MICR|nr:hypothetical protein ECANGB1_62 [Enterospora canceri]
MSKTTISYRRSCLIRYSMFIIIVFVTILIYETGILRLNSTYKINKINPTHYFDYLYNRFITRKPDIDQKYTNEYVRYQSNNFIEEYELNETDEIDPYDVESEIVEELRESVLAV